MKTIGKILVIKISSTRDLFNMNTGIQAVVKFMSSVKTGLNKKKLLILTQNCFCNCTLNINILSLELLYDTLGVAYHPIKVHKKSVHINNISELFFVDQITLVLRGTGRFKKSWRKIDTNR